MMRFFSSARRYLVLPAISFCLLVGACAATDVSTSNRTDDSASFNPYTDGEIPEALKAYLDAQGLQLCQIGIGTCENMTAISSRSTPVMSSGCICGDLDNDGTVDIKDVSYLVSHLFFGKDAPEKPECSNFNPDQTVNSVDLSSLIDFVFSGVPESNDLSCFSPNSGGSNPLDVDIPSDEDSDIPINQLSACSVGSISSDCRCGDVGKKSGFCCEGPNDGRRLWFDSQYNSCPTGQWYYVAPDGSDSNNGLSESAPLKTFGKSISLAKAGDVILASNGTYTIANTSPASVAYVGDTNVMFPLRYLNANSGTINQPITIRGLPDANGNKPIIEAPEFNSGEPGFTGAYVDGVSYWVIDGLEFFRTSIWVWGGNKNAYGNSHDIRIQGNTIHHNVAYGGGNPGLLKIDRADSGGAYNITVKENLFYQQSDIATPYIWRDKDGAEDTRHHAAITVMSLCDYKYYLVPLGSGTTQDEVESDCTGRVDVIRNYFTQVPQAFFFKNSAVGPFNIMGNVIHDVNGVSLVNEVANINMQNNLVYDADTVFGTTGFSDTPGTVLEWVNSVNHYIANNTFVGMRALHGDHRWSRNHLYENNIFFNAGTSSQNPNSGSAAFIRHGYTPPQPADPNQSVLQGMDSRNNCFFSDSTNFLFVSQYTVAGWQFFSHSDALSTFGFDPIPGSKFHLGTNENDYFVDPGNGNYQLKDPSLCPGMGRQ